MQLDSTTLFLFGSFPREVGIRETIYNTDQFIRYLEMNNGFTDCYTSVYPLNGMVDKIYTDWDGTRAVGDVKKQGEWLYAEEIPFVPVLTGKKGFHLYARCKPHKIGEGSSFLLRGATLGIARQALGTLECTLDTHPVGNVRQICRVPNTLRPPENLNWCTYLPSPEFLDMSEEDFAYFMKSPHSFEYDLSGKLLKLEDFPSVNGDICDNNTSIEDLTDALKYVHNANGNEFLKRTLRPCLYEHIIRKEPYHAVRVAVTVDLLEFFPKEAIMNVFKSLNWLDFDSEVTSKQIDSCKRLRPYSCNKIRSLGLPSTCTKCGELFEKMNYRRQTLLM